MNPYKFTKKNIFLSIYIYICLRLSLAVQLLSVLFWIFFFSFRFVSFFLLISLLLWIWSLILAECLWRYVYVSACCRELCKCKFFFRYFSHKCLHSCFLHYSAMYCWFDTVKPPELWAESKQRDHESDKHAHIDATSHVDKMVLVLYWKFEHITNNTN